MTTQQKIRDEISALSRFYGIDPQPFFGLLSPDALEHYVELVLDEQELAVVLGGVGQEDRLLETADKFGIAGEVRSAFKACTLQFPERMLYAKFPVSGKPKGVMYVLLLEPWETVRAFLDFMFPGQFEAAALPGSTGDHSLCFILGFTVDQDQLTIKAYELFDRVGHDRSDPPFLVVHHLTRKGLVPNRKTYAANVSPEDFLAGEGSWPEIVELISGTPFNFGDYAMLRSLEASGKQKMYVFRLDRRENATFNLRTYNYYVAEGLKNIQLQRFEAAHRSFENAVDYDPENPDAINGLGFCMMYRGKYAEGIELVLKARALNPRIANLVWNWGYPPGNIRELIEDLSRQIAEKPAADLFHQRGIYYFQDHDYGRANADLLKAVDLDPLNAEAHNNLGGTYLKLGQFVEAVKCCNIAYSINRQISTSNLGIAREVIRLINETETNPGAQSFISLGKFLYQLDLFEAARENFYKAEAWRQLNGNRSQVPANTVN